MPALLTNVSAEISRKLLGTVPQRGVLAGLSSFERQAIAKDSLALGSSLKSSVAQAGPAAIDAHLSGARFAEALGTAAKAISEQRHDEALVALAEAQKFVQTPAQGLALGRMAIAGQKTAPWGHRGHFKALATSILSDTARNKPSLAQVARLATLQHGLGETRTAFGEAASLPANAAALGQIARAAASMGDTAAIETAFRARTVNNFAQTLDLAKEYDATYRAVNLKPIGPRRFEDPNHPLTKLSYAGRTADDATQAALYLKSVNQSGLARAAFGRAAENAATSGEAIAIAEAAARALQTHQLGVLGVLGAVLPNSFAQDEVLQCYFAAMKKATGVPEQLAVLDSAKQLGFRRYMVDRSTGVVRTAIDKSYLD